MYSKDFLLELDKQINKTTYAKVIALTFDESPIESIEGRVTQGSISVDGASAVRRSCSLTIVAQDFQYDDFYWGLNTKFKLQIGVKNTVDDNYPEIIWFDQGIYLLTSFNTSRATNNFTIQLQGKDKMCLLNGEIGGSLESSVDFGKIEEEDEEGFGIWTITQIPIYDIIRNMVHQYGGEPYHNIVINDLDDLGLELLEYRYDTPMYLYQILSVPEGSELSPSPGNTFDNIVMDGSVECSLDKDGNVSTTLAELSSEYLDTLVDTLVGSANPKSVYIEGCECRVAKISYGDTAGYRTTDLTYAGDLIANVGESITSVLDKIKNMLSEFEYFYDLDGRFVFQRKQSFVNTLWTPIQEIEDGDQYVESLATSSSYSYIFNGSELITAFSNNPNLLNMRNDYSVWGERESVSGAKIPVHLRYAIDTKPTYYKSFERMRYFVQGDQVIEEGPEEYCVYYTDECEKDLSNEKGLKHEVDWREIIYQMAKDYYKHGNEDSFQATIIERNGDLYPSGRTGYEHYYIDMDGFWRQLYNPYIEVDIAKKKVKIKNLNDKIKELTDNNKGEDVSYYNDLIDNLLKEIEQLEKSKADYYGYSEDETFNHHWNKNVYEAPQLLNFWFDFLDSTGELSQFNIKNVGVRPKAINDTNIKSIYFRETPDVIFRSSGEAETETGYKYIQVPNIDSMFSISVQGKSAKDKLDELIYQHSYCIESATITSIPIYYLQPNTRVHLFDQETGLNGDYIVSKFTIPLTYNGTMSITATKAAENII